MKKPAQVTINLLPKDPFYDSIVGKFFRWALSAGRYLVIFTEVIVIMSFASRFYIDRQITDLNTQLLQKQVIARSYGDLEKQIRSVQKKIESYTQVEQQGNVVDVFPTLTEITPNEVRLTRLELKPGTVILSGVASSNVALSLFISNIQNTAKFSDVVVNKIGTAKNSNQGFEFEVQAVTPLGQKIATTSASLSTSSVASP